MAITTRETKGSDLTPAEADENFLGAMGRVVRINSAADFPDPSGGIITLDESLSYFIEGNITVADSIDINDSTIFSVNRPDADLTYTDTTGSLFVGSEGGTIRSVELSAPNGTASIFNIDNSGEDKIFSLIDCRLQNSVSLGVLQGFLGLRISSTSCIANADGMTITDPGGTVEITGLIMAESTLGTQLKLMGDIPRLQLQGGRFSPASGQIGLDITGVTSIGPNSISGGLWNGVGASVNGLDANLHFPVGWQATGTGLRISIDALSSGQMAFLATNATVTPTVLDTPIKVVGTTTENLAAALRFTHTNGRLTYVGDETIDIAVSCTASVIASSNNQNFSMYIAKNGTELNETKSSGRVGSSASDEVPLPLHGKPVMTTNDFIEVFIENTSGTIDLTVTQFNLIIGR